MFLEYIRLLFYWRKFQWDKQYVVNVEERHSGNTHDNLQDHRTIQILCNQKHFHQFRLVEHSHRFWRLNQLDNGILKGTRIVDHWDLFQPNTCSKCSHSKAMAPYHRRYYKWTEDQCKLGCLSWLNNHSWLDCRRYFHCIEDSQQLLFQQKQSKHDTSDNWMVRGCKYLKITFKKTVNFWIFEITIFQAMYSRKFQHPVHHLDYKVQDLTNISVLVRDRKDFDQRHKTQVELYPNHYFWRRIALSYCSPYRRDLIVVMREEHVMITEQHPRDQR